MTTANELLQYLIANSPPEIIGIMQGQDGWETIEAYAEVMERISAATDVLMQASTPGKAFYGAYATGTVSFSRTGTDAANLGIGTILKGRTGIRFTLTEELDFLPGQLGPKVGTVTARIKSTHGNLLPGEPLFIVSTPDGATYDPTISATVVSLSGGAGPVLEMIGMEKNLAPAPGETEAAFRKRFRTMDDFGTPPNIEALVHSIFPTAIVIEAHEAAAFADDCYTAPGDMGISEYLFYGDMPMDIPTNGYMVLIPYQIETDSDWCYASVEAYSDYGYAGKESLVLIDLGDGLGDTWVDAGTGSVYTELAALTQSLDKLTSAGVWYAVFQSEKV